MRTKTVICLDTTGAVFSNDPDMNMGVSFKPVGKVTIRKITAYGMEECGSCGALHRAGYHGDCRNDDERFHLV